MEKFHIADIPKTDRITHLVDNLYAKMPVIESARAKLVTESYKADRRRADHHPQSQGICPHPAQYSHHYP